MKCDHALLFTLLISLASCPTSARSDESPPKATSKYDSVYLVENDSVYLYLAPDLTEWRFNLSDFAGPGTSPTRNLQLNGVPHRVDIHVADGRVQSVAWDERAIRPTTLTREAMNELSTVVASLVRNRWYLTSEEATDEQRLSCALSIAETLKTHPDLALAGEPNSLLRYDVAKSLDDGIVVVLHGASVEVVAPLLDKEGKPQSQRVEFAGGHTLEVRIAGLQVLSVQWDGKPVPPAFPGRTHFILPPGLLVWGTSDRSMQFMINENGHLRQVRFQGKVLSTTEKPERPYYVAQEFYVPNSQLPTGKLVTIFNATVKPSRPVAPAKKEGEPEEPRKFSPRTWKDLTGAFSLVATFVELRGEQVVLQRADGVRIEVPLAKLSAADQAYVQRSSR